MAEFKINGTSALASSGQGYTNAAILEFPRSVKCAKRSVCNGVLSKGLAVVGGFLGALDMVKSLRTESFTGRALEGVSFAQSVAATTAFTAIGIVLLYLFV